MELQIPSTSYSGSGFVNFKFNSKVSAFDLIKSPQFLRIALPKKLANVEFRAPSLTSVGCSVVCAFFYPSNPAALCFLDTPINYGYFLWFVLW